MRMVLLSLDAYAGHGGVAELTRQFVSAAAQHAAVERVRIVPLQGEPCAGALPTKVEECRPPRGGKPGYVARCLGEFLAFRPDVIVCGHMNLAPVASLLRRLRPTPVWSFMHGIEAWQPPASRARRIALRDVDHLIAPSSITIERLARWVRQSPAQLHILHPSVDIDAYTPGPKPEHLLRRWKLDGRQVLLTLSRLSSLERYKGHDQILDVLPALARAHPRLCYVVAGDGDDRARLQARAYALDLGDRVRFIGQVPAAEKRDLLRLADVFAMPSSGEGFGIVYLEALACGIPTIAGARDGGRDALRDGALGLLVDPDNRSELAVAIASALARPRGVVPDGLAYFSSQNFVARVHQLLEDCAPRPALR